MNVIMTGNPGGIVEIQGTAEGEPFTRTQMNELVDMAEAGIGQLIAKQKEALARMKLVVALEQPGQAARVRPDARPRSGGKPFRKKELAVPRMRGTGTSPSSKTRWPRPGTQRPVPDCQHWPMTPACAYTRLAGRRASISARYSGEPKSDERNNEKLVADLR